MSPRSAGQGISPSQFEKGSLLYQTGPSLNSGLTVASFQLPLGSWWQVDLLSGILDATGAVGNVTYAARATVNGVQLFYITGLFAFVGGAFEGSLVFARGLEPQDSTTDDYIGGNLPECWLPPGSTVHLEVLAAGGTVELASPVLLARSVEQQE